MPCKRYVKVPLAGTFAVIRARAKHSKAPAKGFNLHLRASRFLGEKTLGQFCRPRRFWFLGEKRFRACTLPLFNKSSKNSACLLIHSLSFASSWLCECVILLLISFFFYKLFLYCLVSLHEFL